METHEAAELVETIARSIAENPGQFHFEINITGTQATAIGGGTGLSVHAAGGAPGSSTIGFQSNISGANIKIAQKAANAAIEQEISALVRTLNELTFELRSKTPDKKHINAILDSLKQSWIPNAIISMVTSIITKTVLS